VTKNGISHFSKLRFYANLGQKSRPVKNSNPQNSAKIQVDEGSTDDSKLEKKINMKKFLIDSEQFTKILERTIDLFLDYQYKRGYDEPRARSEAILAVVHSLKLLDDCSTPSDS
jgi:hypothetical protein